MPRENLSQDFFIELCKEQPKRTLQYFDKDLKGFLLEYRKTGIGTWYFLYKSPITGNKSYFRIGSTKEMDAAVAREQAYRVHFIIADGDDPKESTHTSKGEFVSEAKNIRVQRFDLVSSRKPKAKFATQYTVKQFIFEQYIPYAKLKKKTWNFDKQTLNTYFIPTFGHHLLATLKSSDLLVWQEALLEKGLTKSTCNRILATIKSVFAHAVKSNILELFQNPCLNIANFPIEAPQPRYLDENEIKKVFTTLQSMKMIGAKALQLLLLTGANKSEIITARWEYVDFEGRTLLVPATLFTKGRTIPLSDEALHMLEKLFQKKRGVWIFPANNPSKHITSLFYVWDAVRKENGLGDVRIQDLRHSFGSFLMSSGASLQEVQKILGHNSPKSTARYAHFAKNALIDATNKVSDFVSS